MSTNPQPTAEQIEQMMQDVLNEKEPHEGAVMFDDMVNVLGSKLWGNIPGQNGLPDMTISSHVREVSDDPKAHDRLLAVVVNKALNLINPNKGLGHGVGAEVGDLTRALRIVSLMMAYLKIAPITVTAGEDPAKIPIKVTS